VIAISFYNSPVGWLRITADEEAVTELYFMNEKSGRSTFSAITKLCINELDEYFGGKLDHFTVPLKPFGSEFQRKVWDQLLTIPYGKTVSYAFVAGRIGDLKSIRAVGTANGRNPIAIIIPCHRVIGSDGSLTGYGGGLWRKKWLLDFERKTKQAELF
jgi:methylated-DNA-[protein]-cysteine S-methyltransferase